jgi:hypothetical protein
VKISERIANNFLSMRARKGYALLEIKAIVQRSVATLVDRDEVEMTLAVINQYPLVTLVWFEVDERTYAFLQLHKLVVQPKPNQPHTHMPNLP